MSTRCQIKIEGFEPMLYKHCDGYPEGVLPDLLPFLARFVGARGWDPEYMLARMAQAMTNASDKDISEIFGDRVSTAGFGIDCSFHYDIEYLYIIRKIRKVDIYSTNFWDNACMKNAKKIKTETF